MLDYFDKFTKPVFKDSNETSYIKFGSMGCNYPRSKIRRGQLQLSGYVFPSLCAIVVSTSHSQSGDGFLLPTGAGQHRGNRAAAAAGRRVASDQGQYLELKA